MGTKRPDVVRRPPIPAEALTVDAIKAAGWQVRAVCPVCKARQWANLDTIARAIGGGALLWGRSTACRAWVDSYMTDDHCPGRLYFEARSIRGGSWRRLTMSGEVRDAWDLLQGRPPSDGLRPCESPATG